MAMQLPGIKEIEKETITCPNCEKVQEATAVLYEGAPFWSKLHECTGCGYVIMESEWEAATDEQIEMVTIRHHNALLTAVAQAAYEMAWDVKTPEGDKLARALMNAVHAGAFRPRGK